MQRQRGQAELPGTCIAGESQRVVGTDFFDRGQWKSGTRCSSADGGSDPGRKARDIRWRQELRHPEFVRELRGMNITPHVAQNDSYRSISEPCDIRATK